ncbi:MAG TPA: carboxypeptidase regulatory-like domain-containing protein [Terriglobia bacterium]|nr:carboxypeptidase regulatory-like domain-containing protein [Terriglobia bacterium]
MKQGQFSQVVLVALAFALMAVVPQLRAQTETGSVSGSVTDPSGAAVPGASITLRNGETGAVTKTVSNSSGVYGFPVVPVGSNYSVSVEAKGFRTYVQSGITLLINQALRVDAKLAIGSEQQSVEVSAQAVQVATENTSMGDVIESRKMLSLPLNGRSYIDLLGLQAGVVPETSQGSLKDRPVAGNGNSGNFSVNGGREASNGFMLNGGSVEEGRNNGAGLVPNLDSIEEFKVITNAGSAEYGQYSGAIVNVVTKGGTNEWHGNGFEFVRNEKFGARNFFDQARGTFKRNQFGGTIGGPIIKNRLFIFGDYQGTRQSRGISTGSITVPTVDQRAGNLSDPTLPVSGLDPAAVVKGCAPGGGCLNDVLSTRLGYTVNNGEPYYTPTCTTSNVNVAGACVFPGGIIPQKAWSAPSIALEQFIPEPTPGLGGATFSTTSQKQHIRDDKFSARGDLDTQGWGRWSLYYALDNTNLLDPYPQAANVPGFPASTPQQAMQTVLSNTRTFGSRNVNEAHAAFFRTAMTQRQPQGGLVSDLSSLGFVTGGLGILPVVPSLQGVPLTTLDNSGPEFGLPDGTTGQFNNTYQISDNFSTVRGKHTIKFGGNYQRFQINERNTYAQNGVFDFNGNETGSDFADFLIGAPVGFIQSSRQFLDSRSEYGALFVADSYKLKSNLTLNYGLRWETSTFFRDKLDRTPSNCRIQAINFNVQSTIYPTAPKGWLCPGDPGVAQGLAPNDYKNFAPRIGVAYSPGFSSGLIGKVFGGPGKSSIRASYGIYYTNVEDLTQFFEVGDVPAGLFYVSPTQVYYDLPYKNRQTPGGPGQRFPFTVPNPQTINWAQLQPIASSPGFDLNNKLPYSQHYDFSIQREFAGSTLLTLAYVGTNGHHLIAGYASNPGIAATCLATPGCGPNGEDSSYDLGGGNFQYGTRTHSVTSGRFAFGQGLNAVLDFGPNQYTSTIANSVYNSLQITMEKRVGAVQFLGAYTWSKSLDDASAFASNINPFNAKLSRGLSSYDVAHNFVFSYTWALPGPSAGVGKAVLGGWIFSGITRLTTGFPIGMGDGSDNSLCGCSGVDKPNWSGQSIQIFDPRNTKRHQYFSRDTFSEETLGVPGNAGRAFFHGPGIINFDMAVHKDFKFTERVGLEYRAEFFNAFNHAQFNNPSGSFTSSSFGRVTSARDPRIIQMGMKLSF